MRVPVVLRDEARGEFDEAFDFYESRQPGSGVAFAKRVQDVFDRISSNPELYAIALTDIRKAIIKRSSYCVYYTVPRSFLRLVGQFEAQILGIYCRILRRIFLGTVLQGRGHES